MNLWIRSQDRQDLIKVDGRFHVQETSVNPHSHKWGILIDGRCYYAEYSTEERALEVLDDIQKKINDIHKDYLLCCMREKGSYEVIAFEDFTYEMPKE